MGKLKYLETMLRNTNDSNAIESYLTSMTAMVEATSKDIKTAKCFSTVKNLQNSKSGLVGARARYLIKMWKRQEEEEKEMEDDDVVALFLMLDGVFCKSFCDDQLSLEEKVLVVVIYEQPQFHLA